MDDLVNKFVRVFEEGEQQYLLMSFYCLEEDDPAIRIATMKDRVIREQIHRYGSSDRRDEVFHSLTKEQVIAVLGVM